MLLVALQDSEMDSAGPKPVAAVQGTTISVEDLFYNVPTRRKVWQAPEHSCITVLGGSQFGIEQQSCASVGLC